MKIDTKKLELAMARKEIGVRELAIMSGTSPGAISKYIRGLMNPSIKNIGKISRAIGVDVTEIIEVEKKE